MAEQAKGHPGEAEAEANSPYASTQRAYLLTLYYPKEQLDISFVTVQASHSSETHRFVDIADAFSYLLSVTQRVRRKNGEAK